MDAGPKLPLLEPARWAKLKQLMAGGAGLVMLHQSMDVPADHAEDVKGLARRRLPSPTSAIAATGTRSSPRSRNTPSTAASRPFPSSATAGSSTSTTPPAPSPSSPAPSPTKPAPPPMRNRTSAAPETMAWAYERPTGGRGFGFTGGDMHRNWISQEQQRRLVTNGILWTAGLEIPAEGAPAVLGKVPMNANLDTKPAKTPAAEKPAAPVAQ